MLVDDTGLEPVTPARQAKQAKYEALEMQYFQGLQKFFSM